MVLRSAYFARRHEHPSGDLPWAWMAKARGAGFLNPLVPSLTLPGGLGNQPHTINDRWITGQSKTRVEHDWKGGFGGVNLLRFRACANQT